MLKGDETLRTKLPPGSRPEIRSYPLIAMPIESNRHWRLCVFVYWDERRVDVEGCWKKEWIPAILVFCSLGQRFDSSEVKKVRGIGRWIRHGGGPDDDPIIYIKVQLFPYAIHYSPQPRFGRAFQARRTSSTAAFFQPITWSTSFADPEPFMKGQL